MNPTVWKHRYSDSVEKMTSKYEMINKLAETHVHKATPEETEYYEKLLEGEKDSVHKLKRSDTN